MFINQDLENLLKALEEQRAKYWNISRFVAVLMWVLFDLKDAQRILEIGTSSGYSAIWLAKAVEARKGRVFTVESHQERFELASQNIQAAGLHSIITQIKGHAPEVLLQHEEIAVGNFDGVFLDATKMEYLDYLAEVSMLHWYVTFIYNILYSMLL